MGTCTLYSQNDEINAVSLGADQQSDISHQKLVKPSNIPIHSRALQAANLSWLVAL